MSASNFPSDRAGRPGHSGPEAGPTAPADDPVPAEAGAPTGASETRSSAIMAAGTLVSRFLGFGKTWMLGTALGLGSTVNDTFINANNLPNLIFLLVAGGVFNAVLVPQIIKASKAPDRGADYISRLLTLAVLLLLGLTALVTLAAPVGHRTDHAGLLAAAEGAGQLPSRSGACRRSSSTASTPSSPRS